MKKARLLTWIVLGSVGTLAACGGVSDIGSGDDPGKAGSTGMNVAGKENGAGASTSMGAATSVGAGMGYAGKDPNGMGGATFFECKEDFDCELSDPFCQICDDGAVVCPKAFCAAGKCQESRESCNVKCENDMDCPVPDLGCADCGDGTKACATSQCLKGQCQSSFPGCGNIDPCQGLPCGTECKSCGPDGMCDVNVASYCSAEGKCQPGLPQCADPGMCKTSMDCGTAPPNCVPCGSNTCAAFDCIEGKCAFTCPPNPEPQCKTSDECKVVTDECKMCPSGKCALGACIQDSCQLVCPL